MKAAGILKKQEKLSQRVGTCWRCKTPIEILSNRQWFIRIKQKEIRDAAHQITVVPRAHVAPDGELDRPDGVGLVHLPAADLCDPDPGLVL